MIRRRALHLGDRHEADRPRGIGQGVLRAARISSTRSCPGSWRTHPGRGSRGYLAEWHIGWAVSLDIRPVAGPGDLRRFIPASLGALSYEPRWIAPLTWTCARLDRERNPFFKHAQASTSSPGRRSPGRADHPPTSTAASTSSGNRWACSASSSARTRARARTPCWRREGGCARTATHGSPDGLTTNDDVRLLIEGHERPPIISRAGITPTTRSCSRGRPARGDGPADVEPAHQRPLERARRDLAARGARRVRVRIAVRPMRKRDLDNEVTRFLEVLQRGLGAQLAAVPLTRRRSATTPRTCGRSSIENWPSSPSASTPARSWGGADAARTTTRCSRQPAWAPAPVRLGQGALLRGKIDAVRVFALGVKPEFRHGRRRALLPAALRRRRANPQKGGEMGWVLETTAR